jgi:hypothetical protein
MVGNRMLREFGWEQVELTAELDDAVVADHEGTVGNRHQRGGGVHHGGRACDVENVAAVHACDFGSHPPDSSTGRSELQIVWV